MDRQGGEPHVSMRVVVEIDGVEVCASRTEIPALDTSDLDDEMVQAYLKSRFMRVTSALTFLPSAMRTARMAFNRARGLG